MRSLLCGPVLLLLGCGRVPEQHKAIGIQVWGHFPQQDLADIRKEATAFFQRDMVLLPMVSFPESYCNREKGIRYTADSIIRQAALRAGDSLRCVVALTDADIYTAKRDRQGHILQPVSKYKVWGIFGLGYQPGKACVVSVYRLRTTDQLRYRRRLRTVMIHEIGHNLGLPHCRVPGCIMSDANESIATIDNSSNDYCHSCRKRAGLPVPAAAGR